jgi:DNA-binding NarL/FixJ family response regulator
MSTKKIRVVIVDDHFVVRIGLTQALNNESDIQVVGEASTGQEAIEICAKLQPDVVLMDLRLPQMSGIETAASLRSISEEIRIVMFSTFSTEEDVFRAFQAGAGAYVSKMAPREELMEAIRQVAAGEYRIPAEIARKLAGATQRTALSARELQVLECIVRGLSNKEIGSRLEIAEVTVKVHVSSLLAKLKVADRTQAATAAIQRGLVRLD